MLLFLVIISIVHLRQLCLKPLFITVFAIISKMFWLTRPKRCLLKVPFFSALVSLNYCIWCYLENCCSACKSLFFFKTCNVNYANELCSCAAVHWTCSREQDQILFAALQQNVDTICVRTHSCVCIGSYCFVTLDRFLWQEETLRCWNEIGFVGQAARCFNRMMYVSWTAPELW